MRKILVQQKDNSFKSKQLCRSLIQGDIQKR